MREAGTIREAGMADLESMVELLGELFSLEADFAVNPKAQRRGLSLMLRPDPDRVVLVAEQHGETLGMATAQLVISTAEGGPSALVEDVVVRPGHRGRGLGRALLDGIAGWASSRGATRLQLLCDRENAPALDFYAACGWSPTQLVCIRRTGFTRSADFSGGNRS
jgi:GNAT superfamily N-acetyltransferase